MRALMRGVLNSFLLFLGRRGRADSTLRKPTLCGDQRGQTEDFLQFLRRARATVCGERAFYDF